VALFSLIADSWRADTNDILAADSNGDSDAVGHLHLHCRELSRQRLHERQLDSIHSSYWWLFLLLTAYIFRLWLVWRCGI